MAVDVDELRCDHCGHLIQLQGQTWVHVEGVDSECPTDVHGRDIHSGRFGNYRARLHHLEVAWHQFSNGSESYTLVHEGVEYVLWQHPATADPHRPVRWSAWRVEISDPGLFTDAAPKVTSYYRNDGPQGYHSMTGYPLPDGYQSHVADPRQLLAVMPPLVAYWLTEDIYPF